MKKLLLFSLLLFFLPITNNAMKELVKGDSLQILYNRVWAYENPDDLSTRVGPYSYFDKPMVYLGTNDEFPGYYQITTPDDKTAYIKTNLLADSPKIKRAQVMKDIEDGRQFKSQYLSYDLESLGIEWWHILIFLLVLLYVLYKVWKNYYKIDRWFMNKSVRRRNPINKPWFITLPALSGTIIGSFAFIFAKFETEWFLNEGLRVWANYPSYIDWILWSCFVLFFITFVAGFIYPFRRMDRNIAVAYSITTAFFMLLYFTVGVLSGGIITAIIIIYFFFQSSGGGGQGGGSNQPPSVNTQGTPNTVYDPSRSKQWNESERFYN